jgi:hypothetical protein
MGMLAIAGCGSSVDQQSAVKVMSTALTGTGQAQAKLMPASGSSTASYNGTVTNPAGSGSATVSGTATQNGSAWSFVFDITYNHWTDAASNVTIDGALHETANFSSLNPLLGSFSLTGMLTASGAVQAHVDFNLSAVYSTTSIKITGNVGGNSVDETVATGG